MCPPVRALKLSILGLKKKTERTFKTGPETKMYSFSVNLSVGFMPTAATPAPCDNSSLCEYSTAVNSHISLEQVVAHYVPESADKVRFSDLDELFPIIFSL